MEFSKEETNPLMFGYWGNKVFRNGFVTFVIPFILTLRKPNMIFSILFGKSTEFHKIVKFALII